MVIIMSSLLEHPVLVLNRLWQPVHICSVRRALKLLCLGHAEVVQTEGDARYQTHDISSWITHSAGKFGTDVIHSVSLALRIPKIIVLSIYDRLPRKEVKFTRANIFLRDKFTCQYCCKTLPEKELNLDHIIPRARGGQTTWQNIVTSCITCNTRKANKLLAQSGMKLLKIPTEPRWRPNYGLKNKNSEKSWQEFIHPERHRVKMNV